METQLDYRKAVAKKDSAELGEVCYLLGKRYTALGDFLTAKRWFIQSLRIREPKGYSEAIGKVYLRLTENHVVSGQFKEARVYARRALVNNQKVQSVHGLMASYLVLSGTYGLGYQLYEKQNKAQAKIFLDSTYYCERQAIHYARVMKAPNELANLYSIFSSGYRESDPQRAMHYANYALSVYTKQHDYNGLFNSYLKLVSIYTGQRKFDRALAALQKAQKFAKAHQRLDFLQSINMEKVSTDLYQNMGQWKDAFYHLEKVHTHELAALSADREGALARLEIEYETQKKELLLQSKNDELARRNQFIVLISVLLLLTLLISVVFFRLFRKNRRISRWNAGLVSEQNHRVKNNLQVVSSLLGLHLSRLSDPVAKQAVEESQLRVQAMAVLHRRLYDGDQLVKVNLATYIPDLVNGILQAYGFGTLQPVYQLQPIWLHVDKSVPLGLMINELLVNACKYAFTATENPSLMITCSYQGSRVHLTVADNGPGFSEDPANASFGMWLITMLAEQLEGAYEFQQHPGTTFHLSFNG
ncbi:histidine kinase dimerization/phosphoacceptor domain -containing protein [Siphonobacter sp. SORGH_AS_0500]|uniref:histidine kinase dimerization/phosphoacceptor domain -containing protein n=1 Tax=Siphonobacter sp. SORGH_AS_0500 TaxID=1864824 RepID=UPI001E588A71|nr:histidine kinase dimerization/phosphoacceptor domain -containing protein [Siphonobacter sp. SORGH_AS_0500]